LAIETPRGLVTLANDFVIAMTGYQPDFSFLESMGVSLSNDEKRYPYYDKTTMETNVAGLYLAGVVCGGMDTHVWFIENSRVHALQITQAIQQKK
jgi:thioredoxin reductase (NADPH)